MHRIDLTRETHINEIQSKEKDMQKTWYSHKKMLFRNPKSIFYFMYLVHLFNYY